MQDAFSRAANLDLQLFQNDNDQHQKSEHLVGRNVFHLIEWKL